MKNKWLERLYGFLGLTVFCVLVGVVYGADLVLTDSLVNLSGTNLTVTGYLVSALIPGVDDSYDFGNSSHQFRNGYFDGTFEADVLTQNGVSLWTYGGGVNYANMSFSAGDIPANIITNTALTANQVLADANISDQLTLNSSSSIAGEAVDSGTVADARLEATIDRTAFTATQNVQTPLINNSGNIVLCADGVSASNCFTFDQTGGPSSRPVINYNDTTGAEQIYLRQIDDSGGDNRTQVVLTVPVGGPAATLNIDMDADNQQSTISTTGQGGDIVLDPIGDDVIVDGRLNVSDDQIDGITAEFRTSNSAGADGLFISKYDDSDGINWRIGANYYYDGGNIRPETGLPAWHIDIDPRTSQKSFRVHYLNASGTSYNPFKIEGEGDITLDPAGGEVILGTSDKLVTPTAGCTGNCVTGSLGWNTSHICICTATNTWESAALS